MPRNIDKPLGAVTFLARAELRGRWRALVILGVIAGVSAGLTLASVAGARRTATVYDRYREATAAPDALVFGTLVGLQNPDYSAVLALPEVVDGGTFNLAPVASQEHDMGALPPGDDRLFRTVGRPLLVQGRLPDPKRADEVVINRKAAAEFGLRVGDRLTIASSTDLADFFTKQKPTGGPSVPATIVGIGDSPVESAFGDGEPGFILSGAFLASFPEVPRLPNLVVRLRPGTDVNTFHRNAAAALGVPDIPVRDLGEDRKRFVHSTDLERSGLLIFAAATLLAGLVMVGQALTRTVEAMAESTPTLRALGLTRSELVAGLVLPLSTAAATAGVIAVASALALSEHQVGRDPAPARAALSTGLDVIAMPQRHRRGQVQGQARRDEPRPVRVQVRLVVLLGVVERRAAADRDRQASADHPHAADQLVARRVGDGHEVVHLGHAVGVQESGDQNVGLGPVELLVSHALQGRRELKPPALGVVEDRREHAGAVEPRQAEPVDRPVQADQGGRLQVAEQGVVLDPAGHQAAALVSMGDPYPTTAPPCTSAR